jgi:hypothetical protein
VRHCDVLHFVFVHDLFQANSIIFCTNPSLSLSLSHPSLYFFLPPSLYFSLPPSLPLFSLSLPLFLSISLPPSLYLSLPLSLSLSPSLPLFLSLSLPLSLSLSIYLSLLPLSPLGDGNAAKARYNMQADSYQESVWVDKWRDDIALFLIKQQWSIPSVGTTRHSAVNCSATPDLSCPFPSKSNLFYLFLSYCTPSCVLIAHSSQSFFSLPLIGSFSPSLSRYLSLFLSFSLPLSHSISGLHEIGTHVVRPFFLPPRVKLLDTLQGTLQHSTSQCRTS